MTPTPTPTTIGEAKNTDDATPTATNAEPGAAVGAPSAPRRNPSILSLLQAPWFLVLAVPYVSFLCLGIIMKTITRQMRVGL